MAPHAGILEAMSEENAERLSAFCAGWTTGGEVDLSLLDPDVVYEDNVLPDHTREAYRGHEGVLRATRTWLEPYADFTIEVERIIGSGDRFVSIHRFRGVGRHSGAPNDSRYAYAWTFENGRIVHFAAFRSEEEACAAAGLSPGA
jgi:ketosteroid isomerase-like protein